MRPRKRDQVRHSTHHHRRPSRIHPWTATLHSLHKRPTTSPRKRLYADDTIIYTANKSQETSHKTIQKALTDLSDWCTTNKLTINIQKTKVLHFRGGRRKQYPTQHQTPLLLNNTPLDTVEHNTYLGTTLDHKLSGEQQVKKDTQTANCRLTTLAKIRKKHRH